MAAVDDELPSFSLGLDFDSDFDSAPPSPNLQPHDSIPDSEDDEELRSTDDPRPTLRRLRRGARIRRSPPRASPIAKFDDDIEEFSEEEEMGTVPKPSAQYHSLCSSSKLPLYRQSNAAAASCSQLQSTKRKQPSYDAGSASQRTSCNMLVQNSTANSPIRKFVLVDSDSDDPSITEHPTRDEANKTDMPIKRKMEASFSKPGSQDLWKYFDPLKSNHISTPVFDEVCNEYFHSVKDNTNKIQKPATYSSLGDDVRCLQPRITNWTAQNPRPPSHCYFFHSDPRIRNLVRSRLPYFFPLVDGSDGEFRHSSTSVIDYMSQFNNGEPSQKSSRIQGTAKVDSKKGSRGRRKSTASNAEESSCVENWVNPRSSVTLPTNAGKRRVRANGKKPAGHWYTGAGGRKVYVSGNGQELTGSAAYNAHRKERGLGFSKSRKKAKASKKAKR